MSCENHKKEVAGISDMKALAEQIGDLHYAQLHLFLHELSNKINVDSRNDIKAGRKKLASQLGVLEMELFKASLTAKNIWQISKPFMKQQS